MPFLSASGVSPYNKIRGGGSAFVVPFAFGNALEFDGVNDYVNFTQTASLPNYTVSAWFKPDVFNKFFMSNDNSFSNAWMRFSTLMAFRDVTGAKTGNFSFPALSLNAWHHFILVGTGGSAKLFVDGVESTSGAQALGNMQFSNLGRSASSANTHFNGVIDETAIWTSALTDTQAINQYNSGAGNFANADVEPLIWYKLNETGSTTTALNSGSGGSTYNGTLNNFTLPGAWIDHFAGAFAFGNALELDKINDYVSYSDITLSGEFTVSFWMRPTSFALQAILSSSTASTGYVAIVSATVLQFNGSASANFTVPTMIPNNWYNVIVTRDALNNTKLFLNGSESSTGSVTNSGTAIFNNISNYDSGQFRFGGALDELGIKTGTAATALNIATLYNGGIGGDFTVIMGANDLNYHLNETGTATTAVDSGGSGNNGTLNNFTFPGAWVPHDAFAFGNALEFDGINDNVTFSNITLGTNATHSFWFKINSYNTDVMWGNATDNGINFPRIAGTTLLRVGDARNQVFNYTVPNFSDSSWHHCVITKAGTTFRVYLDGAESSDGAQTNTSTITLNKSGTTYGFFDGLYDDVNLWNAHTATAAEVSALYNGGAGQYSEEVIPSPTLHWKLNETGTATTAVDSSGNGNNGTLNNFTLPGAWVPHNQPTFIEATGGTITTDGDYKVHSFLSSGTFTVTSLGSGSVDSSIVDSLIVAGGAGGSNYGGGGAGGLISDTSRTVAQTGYSVAVGAGGAGGFKGANGSNSIFDSLTSIGGGAGGKAPNDINGSDGGSGGGSSYHTGATGGLATEGQGNAGGIGNGTASPYSGGGGGGAGLDSGGGNGGSSGEGVGGNGLASSITGSAVTYAGGGAGGTFQGSAASGGTGGGGNGGRNGAGISAGTVNTGGGGGGYGNTNGVGVSGGSGIVIIRYKFQ